LLYIYIYIVGKKYIITSKLEKIIKKKKKTFHSFVSTNMIGSHIKLIDCTY